MILSIIVAVARNFAIGKSNGLLYNIPEDMKHFKDITMGHTVIMGKKTFDSLPTRPLKGRRNIVLCHEGNIPEDKQGAEWVTSLETAIDKAKYDGEIFVIGGASVYEQVYPIADKIYLTEINDVPEEFDASFPEIDYDKWDVTSLGRILHSKNGNLDYRFITLEKKRNRLFKYGFPKMDSDDICVGKLSTEYIQNDDCEGDRDRIQCLKMESVDNGIAPFIRLSIPQGEGLPGYWSIDGIDDMKKIINDFEKRLNYIEE